MSRVIHTTMAVTSCITEAINKLYNRLQAEDAPLTDMYIGVINGYQSFFIIPSGSKEGWNEGVIHNALIERAELYISELAYEDGSNPIEYTIANYGGEL